LCRTVDQPDKELTLLFLDVDNLKRINDAWGHRAGDLALMETAVLLRETFRESDVLARLGGDEFAVLAVGASAESALLLVARLEEQLRAHNASANRPYHLSLSVGLASSNPDRPCSLDALLERADSRMYEQKQLKQQGQGPHRFRTRCPSTSSGAPS